MEWGNPRKSWLKQRKSMITRTSFAVPGAPSLAPLRSAFGAVRPEAAGSWSGGHSAAQCAVQCSESLGTTKEVLGRPKDLLLHRDFLGF